MMSGIDDRSWANTGGERTQAVSSYVRAFFRSMNVEEFSSLIAKARSNGQQEIVEELYAAGVIKSIVRAILGRIDKGHCINDQISDYIQDATMVLVQIARQDRLDLTKSAGEIASYICLWIEQRVRRVARKDQRWRFSLADLPGDVENRLAMVQDLESYREEAPSGEAAGPETAVTNGVHPALPEQLAGTGPDAIFGFNFGKRERNVLSIFGS